jgi:hypothetical protein
MHGAAASAGCCQGSTMVTAMQVRVAMPVTAAADGGHPSGMPGSAGAIAMPAGHAPPPAAGASLAVAHPAGAGCPGVCCAAMLPRDVLAGTGGIPPAGGTAISALFAAQPARALRAAACWRACRPPGRPGMPLPLFLGVSRT